MKFAKWFNSVGLISLIFASSVCAQTNTNIIPPPSTPVVTSPVAVPVLTDSTVPFSPLFSPGVNTQVRIVTDTNGVAPTLTNVTVGVVQYQGANATFIASVVSPTPVSYQWYKSNGDPINNGNGGATLVLTNVQPTDTGWYYVSAVNAYGESIAASTLCVIYTNVLPQCSPTNNLLVTFGWNYDFTSNSNVTGFNLYESTNGTTFTTVIPIVQQVTNISIPLPMNSNKFYFTLTAVDVNNLESTNTPQISFLSPLPTLKQFNLSVLMLATGVPKIQMQVCPFQTVTLQYSTNLVSWAPMKTLIADKYGNVLWDDLDPKRNSLRFYRVTTQ